MSTSYREASEEYKQKKKSTLTDGYDDMPHKKIKKKIKSKRSNHKHHYAPCVFYMTNSDNSLLPQVGFICDICGRPKDLLFFFSFSDQEKKVNKFKQEHPDYIEIILPKDFNFWKAKAIPLDYKR